uniref:NECA1 protein n=1 Tax=Junco hyemalis TaxID=40217 RepID=A0A8C5IR66_JUNHY
MILHPVPEPRLSLGWDSPFTPRTLQVLHGWSLFNFHFFIVSDDRKLSFDEFKAYFADGVPSGEELHEFFRTIDTHNTEFFLLLDCFSKHLGEYENVLSVLEDLNITILKAMDKTKKDYEEASSLEQFVTGFALKETLTQLQSLECAVESGGAGPAGEGSKALCSCREGAGARPQGNSTATLGQGRKTSPVSQPLVQLEFSSKLHTENS